MQLSKRILALVGVVVTLELSAAIFLLWLFSITPSPVPMVWDEASESFAQYHGQGHAVLFQVNAYDYGYWDSWGEWVSIMELRMAAGRLPISRADLDFSFRCFPFVAQSSNGPRHVLEMFRQSGFNEVAVYFEEQFLFCEQLLTTEIEQLEAISAEGPSSDNDNLVVHFSEARLGFLRSVDSE